MNADTLLQRIFAYGADESGIKDRFMGNAELYKSCFIDFLEEPHVSLLESAMREKDYAAAFTSAHALKGLAGNLGVTAYYEAICTLVESLRAHDCKNVDAEFLAAQREFDRLKALLSDAPTPTPAPAEKPDAAKRADKHKEKSKKTKPPDRFIPVYITVLVTIIACVGSLFVYIFNNYRDNVTMESAGHLIEISHQLKLYIEEEIANDWRIAESVGDSIATSRFENDDEAIFRTLEAKQGVWGVTDVMLYTENGYNISSDGRVTPNDVASDIVDKAQKLHKYLTVRESSLIFTMPIDTDLTYNGSNIVAVSVVQSMETFLDDMNFSSFGGRAWMYLTEDNGVVISKLTHDRAAFMFNFNAITNGRELVPLMASPGTVVNMDAPNLFTVPDSAAFMLTGGGENEYIVSSRIQTENASLLLFYLAPESVVNETMNGFSRKLTTLSLSVTLVLGVSFLVIFVLLYRQKKQKLDETLQQRERMLDLLVEKSQTAFGLFTANQEEPPYISKNTEKVIGEDDLSLKKTADGYFMASESGEETSMVRQINEKMRGWDGKSEFDSGYLVNNTAYPPTYCEILLYPVDETGSGFVGIALDVTQTHEREEMAKNALAMAERANEAKSRFLSNMSHDIRTPMNAIVNMTAFALESLDRPKKLFDYLQTIRESSDHLLRIINDVLDMSRIESGQTVIGYEPFDIVEEMERQADIIRPLVKERSQTLLTDFARVNTSSVRADRLKFSQIIMNLLSNAVKFTPENGAIRFTAEEIPSLRDDVVDLRFTVEDTGIGISADYIDRIFEPFSRADDRRVGRIEGTGLGLSICHSYVNAMGGTIRCESEEGEGSVFTVELFFEKADAAPASVQEADEPLLIDETPFLGMHCLVGEDNDINKTIAVTMLEKLGFLVDTASDGRETVERYLHARPHTYDVIYMDIQMPLLDGYQATVAIRESGRSDASTVPIVAMTANVFIEDTEKARIAGMDGHIGKPIMSFHLIEETKRAIKKRKGKFQ